MEYKVYCQRCFLRVSCALRTIILTKNGCLNSTPYGGFLAKFLDLQYNRDVDGVLLNSDFLPISH